MSKSEINPRTGRKRATKKALNSKFSDSYAKKSLPSITKAWVLVHLGMPFIPQELL